MGGIVLIAIVAIISGTIVKLRRMQIEKENLLMGKPGGYSNHNRKRHNPDALEELNHRIENLETIIAAGDISALPEAGETKEMKEQIKLLSRRIAELEHERFKDDPY